MDTRSSSARIFREKLALSYWDVVAHSDTPILFGAYAGTRDLEQAVRTVVTAHFQQDTSVTPDSIAFLAEEEIM